MKRILALITSFMIFSAMAEDNKNAIELEPVVVATGSEKDLYETPYSVFKMSGFQLHMDQQSRTLAESLESVPGVLLQKTGHGMTSPYLRGVTSQRIVLFADGIRLNNSVLREGPNQYWNLVDHFFYDDVEVLLGPASVLYGSDAIGGVLMARTELEQGDGDGFQWQGGSSMFRYASAEESFSEYIKASFALGEKWSFKLGGMHQNFGDLDTVDSETNDNSDYDQWALNFRGTYWFSRMANLWHNAATCLLGTIACNSFALCAHGSNTGQHPGRRHARDR